MEKTTKSIKASDIDRKWYLVDASDDNLGRVASVVAQLLIGKGKPTYTPHMDNGDFVVVVNSDALKVTGGKETKKIYYRHSGYMGGIKSKTLGEAVEQDSTQVIIKAVRGMLPKNKLAADRLARLKVFAGDSHNHTAQKPEKIGVK